MGSKNRRKKIRYISVALQRVDAAPVAGAAR